MLVQGTLLDLLRTRTTVDCDTLDIEVVKSYGPFRDCTSNQAIALAELQKPKNEYLILQSVELAKEFQPFYPSTNWEELAVEIATIKLQIEISQYVSGFVHVQVNPIHAYDQGKVFDAAIRIVNLFKRIEENFDTSRVCIKIPATWEALQACRKLEQQGITTLATTVFCFHQAALAAYSKCHYIAPYVNRLAVHFEDVVDKEPSLPLCFHAQNYFEHHREQTKTQVLAASLTSVEEIMQLRGVDHITIPPNLLQLLSITPANGKEKESMFDVMDSSGGVESITPYNPTKDDFGYALASKDAHDAQGKLKEALKIFSEQQEVLEKMMSKVSLSHEPLRQGE